MKLFSASRDCFTVYRYLYKIFRSRPLKVERHVSPCLKRWQVSQDSTTSWLMSFRFLPPAREPPPVAFSNKCHSSFCSRRGAANPIESFEYFEKQTNWTRRIWNGNWTEFSFAVLILQIGDGWRFGSFNLFTKTSEYLFFEKTCIENEKDFWWFVLLGIWKRIRNKSPRGDGVGGGGVSARELCLGKANTSEFYNGKFSYELGLIW